MSGFCCKIDMTPSTPVGYADDLATGCYNERLIDRVMEVIYRHGCTWRYEYNARKCGVLVFGESRIENKRRSQTREFLLGPDKVDEKINYDHVGIRARIFDDDVSGIEERLSKARCTLNMISGIGVRKRGLTLATCNVMFWTVIVPSALYGSEIWILNEKSISLIESFQTYACKKLQRFHSKAPNTPALFAIGWIRLVQYIQVKKLLFIRAILAHDVRNLSKEVFCIRARRIFENPAGHNFDEEYSVVLNLINTSVRFGLDQEVRNMVERDQMYSKQKWKQLVWAKAWLLEDAYWQVECRLHRSLDLLENIGCGNRYLTWWYISDKFPLQTATCEIMAKIVCHATLLKADDVRLKRSSIAARFCPFCDMAQEDNITHLVMQCPRFQQERTSLFEEIRALPDGIGIYILDMERDIMSTLLGRHATNCVIEQMEEIWLISSRFIAMMYKKNLKLKAGIG